MVEVVDDRSAVGSADGLSVIVAVGRLESVAVGRKVGDIGFKLGLTTGDCEGNTGEKDGGTVTGKFDGLIVGAMKPVGDKHQADF